MRRLQPAATCGPLSGCSSL